MNVNIFFIATNPFFDAYINSDLLGKLIFIGLLFLSIISWIVLIYKTIEMVHAQKQAKIFYDVFQLQKQNPLSLDVNNVNNVKINPFQEIYDVLKKQTLELLNKNRHFNKTTKDQNVSHSFLSSVDIDFVEAHLSTSIAYQTKHLEKNLFILATVVSLAPFLGLLGTVWGILTTFSELQTQTGAGSHEAVLSGLSLALATTVLGLIDAIPALVGYNYLKNTIKDFEVEMDGFSREILATIEMQYRKVDSSLGVLKCEEN